MKNISISNVEHLTSFRYRGPGELGNGLFAWPYLPEVNHMFSFLPTLTR